MCQPFSFLRKDMKSKGKNILKYLICIINNHGDFAVYLGMFNGHVSFLVMYAPKFRCNIDLGNTIKVQMPFLVLCSFSN